MTDQTPPQPIDLDDAIAGVTAEMRVQLRNLMHAFGIPYTETRQQAEARVAELDGVLHRIAGVVTLAPGEQRPVGDMLDDVRTVLERAGYGQRPGGWVPPYSAGTTGTCTPGLPPPTNIPATA
ncbi:hypothetical protein J1766_gp59 [Gordonia phage Bizzy]|uniref:Uncharacterized protein n=1 Tax=Gordonia phage Bizzy TaxID=2483667 RepID=A0A3G3M8F2_9CAUD|nr:hypothetical protein J1766_gp59 [Gordonia phage Bizzy]AYR02695.1 hypothetical protein SEA_BIZZY_59 [Gordonia phage Bizzy]